VEATKLRRRVAWMHLTQNSQVVAVDAQTLTLGFGNAGARDSFLSGGCDEILRQAAIDVVGTDWRVETIVDPGAQAAQGGPGSQRPHSEPSAPAPALAVPSLPDRPETATATPPVTAPSEPPDRVREEAPSAAAAVETARARERVTDTEAAAAARGAIQQTRPAGSGAPGTPTGPGEEDGHPDDPDADTAGLDTAELLRRELGAEVIDEIPHS